MKQETARKVGESTSAQVESAIFATQIWSIHQYWISERM